MNQVLRSGSEERKNDDYEDCGDQRRHGHGWGRGGGCGAGDGGNEEEAKPEEAALKGVKATKGAGKPAKKAGKAKRETESPRAGSKTAKILDLIGRTKGATLAEIMATTGWQAHSVRGFLSTAGKKHQVKIESEKNEGGARVYRIKN
jgi:Protein of unknown function (DUF3489)